MVCCDHEDDVVQINVYGATLAVLLERGVNILQLLDTHGFFDCVVFDMPKRRATTPHRCQAISEGIPPFDEVEIKEEEVDEFPGAGCCSTPVSEAGELVNCTLSTIYDPEGTKPARFLKSVKEEEAEKEIEKTVRDPTVVLEKKEEISPGVAECLLDVLTQVCAVPQGEEASVATQPGEPSQEAFALDVSEPAVSPSETQLMNPPDSAADVDRSRLIDPEEIKISPCSSTSMNLAHVSQKTFDSADDVKRSIPSVNPSFSSPEQDHLPAANDPSPYDEALDFPEQLLEDGRVSEQPEEPVSTASPPISSPEQDDFPAAADPSYSGALDFPEELLEQEDDLSEQPKEPITAASSPRSDEGEEFFDCSFGEEFEDADEFDEAVGGADDEDDENGFCDPSSEPHPPTKKRRKLSHAHLDGKTFSCEFANCGRRITWKPQYGSARFLRHAKIHMSWPTLQCHFCSFQGAYREIMTYHHNTRHPQQKWKNPMNCEGPDQAKKMLDLWKECFPTIAAQATIAGRGRHFSLRV